MESLKAYMGELVLVRGFFYEILRFEVHDRELRCIAYSDDLNQMVDLSVRDVLSGFVAESAA